jgi:hypothetical protein
VRDKDLYVKSTVNHISQHFMGLSEFHDTLLLIILHFSSDIGDGSLCIEISQTCQLHRLFPLLRLLMIAYICILIKALSW